MQEFFDAVDFEINPDNTIEDGHPQGVADEAREADPIDTQGQNDQQTAGMGGRRGSGAWYRARSSHSITAGHSVTVLQAAYWVATTKSQLRITDAAINAFCSMIHTLLLPGGNLFPPSYHIVKAILEVEADQQYERHLCTKCWRVFPRLPHSAWHEHRDAVCFGPGCAQRRFTLGPTGKVAPCRRAWEFGTYETMLSVLAVPEVLEGFVEYIQNIRPLDFAQNWTFWGSPAGQALDRRCRMKFSNPGPGEIAMLWSFGAPAPFSATYC